MPTFTKCLEVFNFNTFEDFHDQYLKKDVLLLVDSFGKCISTCLKYYNLDPCHQLSAGLSWDAMLKMTGVKLEKISDPDKYMFCIYQDINKSQLNQ